MSLNHTIMPFSIFADIPALNPQYYYPATKAYIMGLY
jgi:hypothetical protein